MNHYMITRDQNKNSLLLCTCCAEKKSYDIRAAIEHKHQQTLSLGALEILFIPSGGVCSCMRLLLCLICQCYSWINIFNSICLLKIKQKKTISLEPVPLHRRCRYCTLFVHSIRFPRWKKSFDENYLFCSWRIFLCWITTVSLNLIVALCTPICCECDEMKKKCDCMLDIFLLQIPMWNSNE